MQLPPLQGYMRRRLLVNYRVDPAVIARQLPPPFRPKLQNGWAVAGICLIRLEQLRPRGLPAWVGLSSENAAHRIAVLWDAPDGTTREGVYIPRRDSNSPINWLAGGRLFPGAHHAAHFAAHSDKYTIQIAMQAADGSTTIRLRGEIGPALPPGSIFPTLAAASAFFEAGSLGYSPTHDPARLEGMQLRTRVWRVTPLTVHAVHSSYFADPARFPPGSAHFDHALLMRHIAHEWHIAPPYLRPPSLSGTMTT